MKDFFVIGMTGPTGSGKSTVGELLCEQGFKIVDADRVARRVTEKGSPALVQLCSAFGDDIMLENGELDRAVLAKKAFADSESLQKLNSITHPAIISLIKQELEALKASGETKVILDAPQLFEAGAEKLCGFVLSVLADREIRLERIKSRDNITDEQAESRINAQKSDDFFIQNSDFVIYNNSDTEALTPQINELIKKVVEVRKVRSNYSDCQPVSINPEVQVQTEKANENPAPKKRFVLVGAIAACVIALIICGIIILTSNGYTKVIDKSIELYRNPCIDTIEEIYPDQMWESLTEKYAVFDENIDSVEDIIENYLLSETQEISGKINEDFGSEWEFEYEIISEQKLDKEICEQISSDIEKATEREIKVKKAYKINISYALGDSKITEGFMSFVSVKIDGDWYVAEQYPEIGWRITVLEF